MTLCFLVAVVYIVLYWKRCASFSYSAGSWMLILWHACTASLCSACTVVLLHKHSWFLGGGDACDVRIFAGRRQQPQTTTWPSIVAESLRAKSVRVPVSLRAFDLLWAAGKGWRVFLADALVNALGLPLGVIYANANCALLLFVYYTRAAFKHVQFKRKLRFNCGSDDSFCISRAPLSNSRLCFTHMVMIVDENTHLHPNTNGRRFSVPIWSYDSEYALYEIRITVSGAIKSRQNIRTRSCGFIPNIASGGKAFHRRSQANGHESKKQEEISATNAALFFILYYLTGQ